MHLERDILNPDSIRADTSSSGLSAGTIVLTLDGELPVEHLAPGDRVITRDSGMAILKDMRVTEALVAPIRVKAGSLGHTRPDRDMLIGPDAKVHIRDWRAEALFGSKTADVPAHKLVDREFVTEAAPRRMRLYTLVFDRAHIVYADGLEVATA